MAFRITPTDRFLEVCFYGTATIGELNELLVALEDLERTSSRTPDRLTDLAQIDNRETWFPIVLEIATVRRHRAFPNAFRSAIVAPDPVSFGYARMFQTVNDNPQIAIRIFESRALAEAWLAEPRADSR